MTGLKDRGPNEPLQLIQQELASVGMPLLAVVPVGLLERGVWIDHDPIGSGSLMVLANAGGRLWQILSRDGSLDSTADPFDSFSYKRSEEVLEQYLPSVERRCLYPIGQCPVDLVALGRLAGWHSASPVGPGIHPEYGLWSAYRALWWLAADYEYGLGSLLDSCSQCLSHDCVGACPAEAVVYGERLDLQACQSHRLGQQSSCARTCLARVACPVGADHAYSQNQIEYHYGISLENLQKL